MPLNLTVTSDGYLTSSSSGGLSTETFGGIIFKDLNATSISISTNDANGSLFSDPYNCSPVISFCSGSWTLQRPITTECFSGQTVGENPSGNPAGCPTNPTYTSLQSNIFTFTNPVNAFFIDFRAFDGSPNCPRMEIKVNGVFYPLTTANISNMPAGSECIASFSTIVVTPDGYLTVANTQSTQCRIYISNTNTNSVTVSTNDGNGTAFSNPFSCIDVIPLKLESFLGTSTIGCKIILDWKTGTESNIKDIEVEKSKDGTMFYKMGEVIPKGSNSHYSFLTTSLTDAYFRLKIIDLDGYYEYSNILNIKSNCSNTAYKVIPNPASSSIEIMNLKKDDKIFILDMLGRIVLTFNSPQNTNKFDIQKLTSGMYIIQIINEGTVKSNIKLLKN